MNKLWLIILTGVFSMACGASGGISPNGATTTTTTAAETKPKAGEAAIFKVSREGFGEGTIEGVTGAQYVIRYGDSTVAKEESDVYALPKGGAAAGVKAGDMVAAKIESGGKYWAGAEVVSANGEVIEVRDLYRGTTANLAPDKIVAVRPAAAADLQKLKAEYDFKRRANAARPRSDAAWKPKTGERVVAEWSPNSWWNGTIGAIKDGKAVIKWGSSFKDSELGVDRLVPYPKADAGALPAADSYVLVKPDSDNGQWFYAQVTGGAGEVKFPDGKTRTVKPGEFIALN